MAIPRVDFELPSGETLSLRGLSGYEVMLSRKKFAQDQDQLAMSIFMLAAAMGVTESEAEAWMKDHLAGDFMAATAKVSELSGLDEGAAKSEVPAL